MAEARVICDDRFYSCFCQLDKDDHKVHKCACGGSWERPETGDVVIHSYPVIGRRVPPRPGEHSPLMVMLDTIFEAEE